LFLPHRGKGIKKRGCVGGGTGQGRNGRKRLKVYEEESGGSINKKAEKLKYPQQSKK